MSVPSVRFNISLPKEFLDLVDQTARDQGLSRSAFIRQALLQKMDMKSLFDLPPRRRQQAETDAFMKQLQELAEAEDAKEDDDGDGIL